DTNGNITALGVGTCKIIAQAKDNSKKKAYCLVYVSKAVPATGVTVSQKDMVLVKGTSSMLAFTIAPNNTTDSVRFYSDNKKVATVSSTGRVSARKPGAATITIRTSNGKVGMVNVTVVGLNRTNITMGQYERIELWVEEKATDVKWYSENASIATVENGSVVSRMKGKTRIVAIVDGIRLYCNVTVR
ncbi:MAG: Ig-like domain-containing protein, partial [Clostridium sp.]|nr:Ig-like domain-containing protein [Clostridium sp.]